MKNIKIIEEQIREHISLFLFELQTKKTVNEMLFERIDHLSRELAYHLKSEELVSKSILNELYTFVKVARAEAPYMKEYSSNIAKKADAIQLTFDLILCGESPGERRSGVPRVV